MASFYNTSEEKSVEDSASVAVPEMITDVTTVTGSAQQVPSSTPHHEQQASQQFEFGHREPMGARQRR